MRKVVATAINKMNVVASVFAIAVLIAPQTLAQSSGSFNYAQQSAPVRGELVHRGAHGWNCRSGNNHQDGHEDVEWQRECLRCHPLGGSGLLTNVTISSKQAAATTSAQAGVDFQVTVTPLSGQPAPTVSPSGPVTYEDRFIQISSNLFSAIASLCLANPDGSGGCFLSFNESTLGAHSFNWVVSNLSSGTYGLTVQWTPSTLVSDGNYAQAATCVGPVNLTVTQSKIFTPSSGVAF